ncbi:ATP-dependent Clp protease proteolytic subunit-related protein 1, chloroplastic [Solanum dulcamara]|uniref:ATP-dependent Clp protease proteolytic subunit-related protein 1, chloroplastic n=1 Tax=Solanum dulcamara TaxID=45834 RepID=UPI0024862EBE|nr:ATP-dependent Clp protease proteolytic subunit-related protein 1, chloroplastic [Solanum dulcamara]
MMQLTSQPQLILVPRPHKEVGEHQKCVLKSEKVSMASSMFLSPLSCPTPADNRELSSRIILHKSTFLPSPNFFFPTSVHSRRPNGVRGYCYRSPVAKSFEHIPQQFRQENLKDGLLNNYKNAPQYLYGLTPSQMDMFMTEDNPAQRQSGSVTEESISSSHNYLSNGGMWSMSGMNKRGPSSCSMSVSMYGGGRGSDRPATAPPDLPSLLLDARIVYLGMPIVEAVTELIVAQFMWLDYDNPSKPVYLYINSFGTQNEEMETVGSETEAYAIADMMGYCKSDVYTVNCGMAFGQAAMLLSLGKKGFRAMQPNSSTKLYLPKVSKSSGAAIDMWIKAKELESNSDYYLELLAQGTGKPKEEIEKDILRPKYFRALEAIDYGLADKIIDSRDDAFDKRNYEEMLAQSRAMTRPGGPGAQAAPSGFR